MDTFRRSLDTVKENVLKLNKNIEILNFEKAKWGWNVYCKCKVCGNEWKVAVKSYEKNPTCPKCRPKQVFIKGVCGVKKRNEDWLKEVKIVHPEYDYSETEYKNSVTSVKVICPKHGKFSVSPKKFIKPEYKCGACKKEETMEQLGKQIIEELVKSHPEYDFSNSVYLGRHKKMKVVCSKHGEFDAYVGNLLKGSGCPGCKSEKLSKLKRYTQEEFIDLCNKNHNFKYDYSKTVYTKSDGYITIICHEKDEFGEEHGEFKQQASCHLNGQGCPKCNNLYKDENERQKHFLKRMKLIHGDKLDFSKSIYVRAHDDIIVTCHEKDILGNEHGDFPTTPKQLLRGHGCPKCANKGVTTELFIAKIKQIHGDRYDYSKTEYKGVHEHIKIICPDHGEFEQQAGSHLAGRGCPLCKTSHIERELDSFLRKNLPFIYVYQYRNKDLFFRQSLDFYIPRVKLAIECQGEQHVVANFFKSRGVEYAKEHLEYIKELDRKKKQICEENGIELVYFIDKKIKHYFLNVPYFGKVFYDKEELLKYILNKTKNNN